jgi:hypothetical protein
LPVAERFAQRERNEYTQDVHAVGDAEQSRNAVAAETRVGLVDAFVAVCAEDGIEVCRSVCDAECTGQPFYGVEVRGGDADRQGQAAAVGDEVELRSVPAAVGGFGLVSCPL